MKIPYHSICKTLKVTKEENVLLYQVNLMLRKDDDSLDECPFKVRKILALQTKFLNKF